MFNNYKGTTLYKVLSPTSDCNFFAVSSAGNQPKIGTKKKKIVFPPVHENTNNGTWCERARCAPGGRSRDALRYRPQVSSVFPHNSRRIAYFLELIALGNHKLRFGCGHQLTISSSIPPRDIGVSTYDLSLIHI